MWQEDALYAPALLPVDNEPVNLDERRRVITMSVGDVDGRHGWLIKIPQPCSNVLGARKVDKKRTLVRTDQHDAVAVTNS
jgi:hypothetical protein